MKTIKIPLILCLLTALFLVACSIDKDDTPPFDGNIIYAPSGAEDNHPTHIHAPSTSAPDTDEPPETPDTDTESSSDTDTDADTTDTDAEPADTTEPSTDTEEPSEDTADTEPAEDTTDSEETLPPPVQPEVEDGVIDMRETLAVGFPVSGQFISEQNPRLSLAVNYECRMSAEGEVTVTLDVGLLAHTVRCGGRPSKMGELTIDGVTYNFSTNEIVNDTTSQVYVPFVTRTYTVDADKSSTSIDASWMFNGSYGGVRIDALTASAKLIW